MMPLKLERIKSVLERTGLCRSVFYNKVRNGEIEAPVAIGLRPAHGAALRLTRGFKTARRRRTAVGLRSPHTIQTARQRPLDGSEGCMKVKVQTVRNQSLDRAAILSTKAHRIRCSERLRSLAERGDQ